MSSFIDYINNGQIGLVRCGMSRADCIKTLGNPLNWIGRPPCIGPIINTPAKSPVWFYYEDSVGIVFGEAGVSTSVNLRPDRMEKCPQIFVDWPIPPNCTMGQFREALVKMQIPFEEGDLETSDYFIIANERTGATCLPYLKGRMLPGFERRVLMIQNHASKEALMNALHGK